MTKAELKCNGYKYIATQNNEAKLEIWARFTGEGDTVEYIYYAYCKSKAVEGRLSQKTLRKRDYL